MLCVVAVLYQYVFPLCRDTPRDSSACPDRSPPPPAPVDRHRPYRHRRRHTGGERDIVRHARRRGGIARQRFQLPAQVLLRRPAGPRRGRPHGRVVVAGQVEVRPCAAGCVVRSTWVGDVGRELCGVAAHQIDVIYCLLLIVWSGSRLGVLVKSCVACCGGWV